MIMDFFVDRIVMLVLVLFMVILAIDLPFAIYQEAVADKFELRKDQWTCSAEHTNLIPMAKGGTIPVTVCDTWQRK